MVTGITHLCEDSEPIRTNIEAKIDLNTIEIDGLKAILEHLSSLDDKKRSVPKEITKPDVLLEAAKVHKNPLIKYQHLLLYYTLLLIFKT